MNKTYIQYLNDTIRQLIELAESVSIQGPEEEFETGKIHGIYICITRILNQAEGFGILDSLDEDITNFEPEVLLSRKKQLPI